jgi:hypothetical protein
MKHQILSFVGSYSILKNNGPVFLEVEHSDQGSASAITFILPYGALSRQNVGGFLKILVSLLVMDLLLIFGMTNGVEANL